MPLPSGYRLIDVATQSYLLFVALVALALRGEQWVALVALHLGTMAAIHCLIGPHPPPETRAVVAGRFTATAARAWLREFYPIFLFVGLYRETVVLNRMMDTPRLDPWLVKADHALLGFQPAEAFSVTFAQPLFSEFMHLSYLSYHLMIGGVGLWLSVRNLAAFRHFVTVVSLVFYACYATYLFVPAVGPRVLFAPTPERAQFVAHYGRDPRPTPATAGGRWAQRTFAFVEEHGDIAGAAFPSSHVAVALVTAWFSWRYIRPIRWLHVVFAVTILFSTVYTRAHYAVDVLGGLVAAAVLFPAAQALYARTGGPRHTGRS
jgi:membrane-associated phospholipid phosphatase